jgi:YVTN family beta-propeller protein
MHTLTTLTLVIAAIALLNGSSVAKHGSTPAGKSKLYVTNSSGDDVTIIDTATLKVIRSL